MQNGLLKKGVIAMYLPVGHSQEVLNLCMFAFLRL